MRQPLEGPVPSQKTRGLSSGLGKWTPSPPCGREWPAHALFFGEEGVQLDLRRARSARSPLREM